MAKAKAQPDRDHAAKSVAVPSRLPTSQQAKSIPTMKIQWVPRSLECWLP